VCVAAVNDLPSSDNEPTADFHTLDYEVDKHVNLPDETLSFDVPFSICGWFWAFWSLIVCSIGLTVQCLVTPYQVIYPILVSWLTIIGRILFQILIYGTVFAPHLVTFLGLVLCCTRLRSHVIDFRQHRAKLAFLNNQLVAVEKFSYDAGRDMTHLDGQLPQAVCAKKNTFATTLVTIKREIVEERARFGSYLVFFVLSIPIVDITILFSRFVLFPFFLFGKILRCSIGSRILDLFFPTIVYESRHVAFVPGSTLPGTIVDNEQTKITDDHCCDNLQQTTDRLFDLLKTNIIRLAPSLSEMDRISVLSDHAKLLEQSRLIEVNQRDAFNIFLRDYINNLTKRTDQINQLPEKDRELPVHVDSPSAPVLECNVDYNQRKQLIINDNLKDVNFWLTEHFNSSRFFEPIRSDDDLEQFSDAVNVFCSYVCSCLLEDKHKGRNNNKAKMRARHDQRDVVVARGKRISFHKSTGKYYNIDEAPDPETGSRAPIHRAGKRPIFMSSELDHDFMVNGPTNAIQQHRLREIEAGDLYNGDRNDIIRVYYDNKCIGTFMTEADAVDFQREFDDWADDDFLPESLAVPGVSSVNKKGPRHIDRAEIEELVTRVDNLTQICTNNALNRSDFDQFFKLVNERFDEVHRGFVALSQDHHALCEHVDNRLSSISIHESFNPSNPSHRTFDENLFVVKDLKEQVLASAVSVPGGVLINTHVLEDASYLTHNENVYEIPRTVRKDAVSLGTDLTFLKLITPVPAVKLKRLAAPIDGMKVGVTDFVNHATSTAVVSSAVAGTYNASTDFGTCGTPVVAIDKVVGIHNRNRGFCPFTNDMITLFRTATGSSSSKIAPTSVASASAQPGRQNVPSVPATETRSVSVARTMYPSRQQAERQRPPVHASRTAGACAYQRAPASKN